MYLIVVFRRPSARPRWVRVHWDRFAFAGLPAALPARLEVVQSPLGATRFEKLADARRVAAHYQQGQDRRRTGSRCRVVTETGAATDERSEADDDTEARPNPKVSSGS